MTIDEITKWIPEALSSEEERILEQELDGLAGLFDLLKDADRVSPLVLGWDVRI